ncbi:MAG: hypothetical protein KUG77_02070 [Nannocystaceae bacterium]|nr:hypothetical protein [Nannocystaceae bacterium]
MAPTVALTLDGEAVPNAILEHVTHTLAAAASDDGETLAVEFWRGNTLLRTLDTAPFELEISFSSVDSGLREYRAVATDSAGLSAEDTLEVSINIAGGNLQDISHDLFTGAIGSAGSAEFFGGAIAEIEGRLYVSATRSDGTGLLLATLPELETQWERQFSGPLWSLSAALGDEELAVAVAEPGAWVAHVLDRTDGSTNTSWVLGPRPKEFGVLGPQIAATPAGLIATTTPRELALFDSDGNALGSEANLKNGVVTELITASDGALVYVGFGDAFNESEATCATNSDFCAQAMLPGGGVSWVTGLSEQRAGIHRLAPTADGGAFVSAAVFDDKDSSFELLKLTTQGVIAETQLHGVAAVDESGDRVMSLSPDNKGGVVACGGAGFLIDEDSSPSPVVYAFDSDLNTVWEARDFVEAEDGAYALACAVTDKSVFVYGLRDMEVEFIDDEPYAVGSAWIARISL